MLRKTITTGLCLFALFSLLLAACSPSQPAPQQPTVDANAVYTQAAQTVQAQMSSNATKAPEATATTQPTETMAPTNTIAPSSTPAAKTSATATPKGNTSGGTTGTKTAVPTATKASTTGGTTGGQTGTSGNKCEYVDQSPKDGTQISKNASWDMTIVVKNSGTTTWDKTYALKFWGGDKMGSPTDFYIQGTVKPGAMYKFVFPMTAPDSTGKKQANWVVQTGDGLNFCFVFLQVEVTK